MLKNITFSAEEEIIEAARARARAEKTTLNEKVRGWLEDYARDKAEGEKRLSRHLDLMERLSHISTGGRKFSRDEMNER
jgi:hypothetical protein